MKKEGAFSKKRHLHACACTHAHIKIFFKGKRKERKKENNDISSLLFLSFFVSFFLSFHLSSSLFFRCLCFLPFFSTPLSFLSLFLSLRCNRSSSSFSSSSILQSGFFFFSYPQAFYLCCVSRCFLSFCFFLLRSENVSHGRGEEENEKRRKAMKETDDLYLPCLTVNFFFSSSSSALLFFRDRLARLLFIPSSSSSSAFL